MSREDAQMKLRLPEALRDRIKAAAEANGRSMNAEIVGALTKAYPRQGSATDILDDLVSIIIHNGSKIKQDDMAVVHELYGELYREVQRLQTIENSTQTETG